MRLKTDRTVPPLNAVRAFEAAARLGGFQAAGRELHVSANAIGRHVKLLEEWLEVSLFRRHARGVALTEAGASYHTAVGDLLSKLAAASSDLRRRESERVLTVSAMPSFVARWLVPRLGRLTARRQPLDVRILASVPLVDFEREPVDVAIRLGPGRYPGLRTDLLMHERFFPVCSPKIARGLKRPSDVARHTLLHDEWEPRIPDQMDWRAWLDSIGAKGVKTTRGVRFSFSHMTLQAAAAGQGIALASSALVGNDLTTGVLVRPFGALEVPGPYAFHIVAPEANAEREKIALFREWALKEAARA